MTPIAWRDAEAEVSDQEPDGAKPTMGSAPYSTGSDGVSVLNSNNAALAAYMQHQCGSILFPQAGPDGATTIINLFQSAGLSTFLHECALLP